MIKGKKILSYLGIAIIVFSLLFELYRREIDFNKGLFSINIGLFIFLSSKLKRTLYLNIFFFSWLIYIIIKNISNESVGINWFVFFYFILVLPYLIFPKNKNEL